MRHVHLEDECVDLWRLSQQIAVADVEHIAANYNLIWEAHHNLSQRLNEARNFRKIKRHVPDV